MDDEKENYNDTERPSKGTIRSHYVLIMCLAKIWKILTAQIREEIFYSLEYHGMFLKKKDTIEERAEQTTTPGHWPNV